MIPRVHKQGSNTLGHLHYLYGKGTREEHIDPHLVASFDGMAPDPGRDPSVTKADLRHLLDQTLSLLDADQRPDKHVWHCSVRAVRTTRAAAGEPMAVLCQRGRRLAPCVLQRQADLLQQVLPGLAARVQAEVGWPALAATLDDVRRVGHDPAALLAEAARRRELDTATSISDVLVWRLRLGAHLSNLAESRHDTPARGSRRQGPSAPNTLTSPSTVDDFSRRR